MAKFDWVDESALDQEERLGLAYCRLSCWEWDPLLGPKPEGFDEMCKVAAPRGPFRRRIPCKHDMVTPAIENITQILGSAKVSWFWWKFVLHETYENWLRWYVVDRQGSEQ